MDAAQVRRWLDGFAAIAEADRRMLLAQGADPARAARLALGLIDAVRAVNASSPDAERLREADDEAVRAIWAVLRERLCR